jgi:precorrin-3B C17-methyltransferase
MTVRARQAIAESVAVVGYTKYIDLCAPFLAGKDIISSAMGQEVERVNLAVDLAVRGKTVSLISSGDSGIYGMSGLAVEILQKRHVDIEVEIVPGVPAMVSAASLLGAPLNIDVASISLSDHLVPWTDIARRIESAAESDFVIAIYNPKSRARRDHLAKAREIVLRHRRPSTPVGIVSNAYRPGQTVTITSLETMLDHPVDMDSLVIIGNSTTEVSGGRLITPRGYGNKYDLLEKKTRRRQANAGPEPR